MSGTSNIGTSAALTAAKSSGAMVLPGSSAPQEPSPPPTPSHMVQQPVQQPVQEIPKPQVPTVSGEPYTGQQRVAEIEVPNFIKEEVEEAPSQPPTPDDDDSDLPLDPAAENFKILRGKIKEARSSKRELESQLQETRERLQKYETGEIVSDVLREKDLKIQELEPYKAVVDAKLSDEYEEAITKPSIQLKNKLEKLGDDYGIVPEIMHQLVGITNKRELNEILSRHFGDVGGLEVKQVIDELHKLGEKALEIEKNPKEQLNSLKAQRAERLQKEQQELGRQFEAIAKEAWGNALEKTKKENVFQELILHPTDSKFNKEVVEPTQHRAAIQYTAFIKMLKDNGLKSLPKEMADGIARMIQISVGSAFAAQGREAATRRANNFESNIRRTQGYMRPSVGGYNGNGQVQRQAPTAPTTVQEASKQASSFFKR